MPENPFKPPDARVRDQPPPPGSPLRAILTGLLVDLGGTAVIGVLLALVYSSGVDGTGTPAAQVAAAADPPRALLVLETLLGALCSVAGGFVCARIARRDEYRTGGIMAGLSAFFGLLLGGGGTSADMLVLLTLCTCACVLLGVKYGREANRRQDAARTGAQP